MDENTSPLRDALREIADMTFDEWTNGFKAGEIARAAVEAEVRSLRSQGEPQVANWDAFELFRRGEFEKFGEDPGAFESYVAGFVAARASPPSQPIASDVVAVPDARRRCESKGGSDYCYHCGKEMSGNIDECRVLTRGIPATAFGCAQEAEGEQVCAKWCGSTHTCPRTLAPAPDVLSRQSPVEADTQALIAELKRLEDPERSTIEDIENKDLRTYFGTIWRALAASPSDTSQGVSEAKDAARYRFWRKFYRSAFAVSGVYRLKFKPSRPAVEIAGPDYEQVVDAALDEAMARAALRSEPTGEQS